MTRTKKRKLVRSAKSGSVDKKHTVDSIHDTPENVAKALFGIKTSGKKKDGKKTEK